MFNEHIENTINVLCDWITQKAKNGGSSEELSVLPEIAKAVAQLIQATKP